MSFFLSTLYSFHKGFGRLFHADPDGDDDEEGGERDPNSFNERFGWMYAAKRVSDFEGISLWECYERDTMSFLNHMVYLNEFDKHQSKLNGTTNRE